MTAVRAFDNPADVLDAVQDQLASSGAEGEVAYGLLGRLVDDPTAWGAPLTMLVSYDAAPTAFVLRTGDYPALIVSFVDEAEVDFDGFVQEMLSRNVTPSAVNGALRSVVPFANAWARATGVTLRTFREMRAFELHTLRPPSTSRGEARLATMDEFELLECWCAAFAAAIDEPLDDGKAATYASDFVAKQDMMLWVVDDEPVSMAVINRRTPNASNVAWVYTPPEHRRHGYGSAVVAAISQRELAAGASYCCLFTDLANPTSNHIYAELGYEPKCDFRWIDLVAKEEG
jgi:GNAT superfamily N-acetyltransferase